MKIILYSKPNPAHEADKKESKRKSKFKPGSADKEVFEETKIEKNLDEKEFYMNRLNKWLGDDDFSDQQRSDTTTTEDDADLDEEGEKWKIKMVRKRTKNMVKKVKK